MLLASLMTRLAALGGHLLLPQDAPAPTTVPALEGTLARMPLDDAGLPLRAPDTVPAGWDGGIALGNTVERDGTLMREVTFGLRVADPKTPAMVHINSLTDRNRDDIHYAFLHPLPGTDLRVRSYLLPEDAAFSYRFVANAELTADIGRTRPGWLKVHSWGKPDEHNPERLPNPLALGTESSVWTAFGARRHPDWNNDKSPSGRTATTIDIAGYAGNVTLHHRGSAPAPKLLVLFDGEFLRPIRPDPDSALGSRTTYDILLINNENMESRGKILTDHARIAEIVTTAVRASEKVLGGQRRAPADIVVAGQSYGGLAAATIAVWHPDVAATAIAQSGSYWFKANQVKAFGPQKGDGDMLNYLKEARGLNARVIVQVGSEEDDMKLVSRRFSTLGREAGLRITHDEWRGGHDYAWWRHGLSHALDVLESEQE